MGNNVIYNDKDECIGFFEDLVSLYKGMMKNEIDLDDMDEVKHLAEELTELYELEDYDGLIVLSENNGMGFTARKYKELERE